MKVKKKKKTVFVAMSGGVDSSVAAALLKERGYAVVGAHMRCFNADGCAAKDAEDARRAAETLGVPFYVFDFEKEYRERVVDYMVAGYRAGITPNPDVMCNKEIKFKLFLEKALTMGADYIATGHYVRLRATIDNKQLTNDKKNKNICQMSNVKCQMFAAKDSNKDQSYFLWTLAQEQLKHCLFPIGEYAKPEVRALARKFGLPNAEKKDSQGICFLGRVTLRDFLGDYIKPRKGAVILNPPAGGEGSHIIGEHRGAHFYTIGQRHIDISNIKYQKAKIVRDPKPVYVVQKDIKANTLTVVEGDHHPALYRNEIELRDVNFIMPQLQPMQHTYKLENVRMFVYARVRYRQPLAQATLTYTDYARTPADSNESPYTSVSMSALVRMRFRKPQRAVASGQSAVFYSKTGEMLGGGVIV